MNNYQQCLNLWGEVLILTIEDYRSGTLAEKRDVCKFLKSEWFEKICEILDIEPNSFRNKILRKQINHKAFKIHYIVYRVWEKR